MIEDAPTFALNNEQQMFMITSGKYNRSQFKYKDVRIEDNTIKYNIEFNEFWVDGGKVTNAHESELIEFANGPAYDMLRNIIEYLDKEQK